MTGTPQRKSKSAPAGRGAGRREIGARTRERILDTAQELFAARGIDGVSINEICKQCDVNAAAVHYHFGTKANLISEIMRRGVETWGLQRDQLIIEVEQRGDATLREVVEVMIRPTAALVEQPWGLNYVRFLYAVSNHPEYGDVSNSIADAHTQRYVALLERVLPHLPREVLLRRYTLSRVFLYQAFSIEHGPLSSWLSSHGVASDPGAREDLVSYFTGAFGAPYVAVDHQSTSASA